VEKCRISDHVARKSLKVVEPTAIRCLYLSEKVS